MRRKHPSVPHAVSCVSVKFRFEVVPFGFGGADPSNDNAMDGEHPLAYILLMLPDRLLRNCFLRISSILSLHAPLACSTCMLDLNVTVARALFHRNQVFGLTIKGRFRAIIYQ